MQELAKREGLEQYIFDVTVTPGGCSQLLFRFPNGYGGSVITGGIAYGSEAAPYEVAVKKFYGEESELCYNTPITDDVIGYCTGERVIEILNQIKALPVHQEEEDAENHSRRLGAGVR